MKVPLKVLGLLRDSLGNVDGTIWGLCTCNRGRFELLLGCQLGLPRTFEIGWAFRASGFG